MTYKDRVQKKAEEMGKMPGCGDYTIGQLLSDSALERLAEKAVRDEGVVYMQGWIQSRNTSDDMSCMDHLQQLGYLKTEEHG